MWKNVSSAVPFNRVGAEFGTLGHYSDLPLSRGQTIGFFRTTFTSPWVQKLPQPPFASVEGATLFADSKRPMLRPHINGGLETISGDLRARKFLRSMNTNANLRFVRRRGGGGGRRSWRALLLETICPWSPRSLLIARVNAGSGNKRAQRQQTRTDVDKQTPSRSNGDTPRPTTHGSAECNENSQD